MKKKLLCVLLTASMLFTNAGMSVLAQEEMQTERSEERAKEQETEENLETQREKKETVSETPAAEEPEETKTVSKGTLAEKEEVDEQETTIVQTLTESVDEEKSVEEGLNREDGVGVDPGYEEGSEKPVEPEKPIAQDTYKDITWSIDKNGKLLVEGTGDFSASTGEYRIPWYAYRENIKTAEIKVKGMTDASYMFASCGNLTDVDLSEFDTSSVTNMRDMFAFCRSLAKIDVSQFDTRNVTDMGFMFYCCENLISLDVSNFHTENVSNMSGMFSHCSLTSLDLTNFNTGNVKDMDMMFWGCTGLTSLDLSSFDVGNVTDMRDMLDDCSALKTIDTPYNVSFDVELPLGTMSVDGNVYSCAWYDKDGKMYSFLPKGLSESILLEKKKFEDIVCSLDENGKLTVEGTGDFPGGSGYGKAPWYELRREIKTAEIKVSGMTDASFMFQGCENLTSVDLSGFDVENVTNMSHMFYECRSLTNINFSGFHTENVTNMSRMFQNCSSLVSLDLSDFKARNVTNMEEMFEGCGSLASLDFSSFDAENVTNMGDMFRGCGSLTSLDLSSFDVGNVTNWYRFSLYDCSALATINTPRNIPSSISLPITERDVEGNVCTYMWYDPDGKMYSAIPKGLSKSILLEKKKFEDIIWNIDENGKLTVEGTGDFPGGTEFGRIIPWNQYRWGIKTAEIKVSGMTDASYMFDGCENLTSVDLSGFDTSSITNMSGMFSWCENLTNVDLSGLDTSNVTDMSGIFQGCKRLTDVDFRDLDTSKVTNMSSMFYGCGSLTNIDFSELDTSNVTNMSGMLSGCDLTNVDFSGLNTSNVTDMSDMFSGCENLTNVDFSRLNTSNVTNMSGMFSGCEYLVSLDLSGLNTEKVTDMSNMFGACSQLTNLHIKSLDTGKVTNMSYMFGECGSLVNLDLSSFNTENVTDMSGMFESCRSLTNLDLSGFHTEKVTDMSYMFDACGLTDIDASGFDTGNATNMERMFGYCKSLINLNLSSFHMEKVTKIDDLFEECCMLAQINTPCNLSLPVELPTGTWSDADANKYTKLPTGRSDSVLLTVGAVDIVESGTYETITWSIDARGKLLVEGTGDFAPPAIGSDSDRAPWNAYSDSIRTAEIKVSGMTDASYMFSGCYDLFSVDFSGFNTENVTNMRGMFYECGSCYSLILDMSGIHTGSVTDMSDMFSGSSLRSIDLSGFHTGNVTNMSGMFSSCYNLTSLDFSSFHTGNVTDMSNMFSGCDRLMDLDLSSFNTENVTDMSGMFDGCDALTRIYTPYNVPQQIEMPSLPSGTWYDLEGNEYTTLPIGRDSAILLAKDEIPVVTAYITATKTKKTYTAGDIITIDDLKVIYYGTDGTVKTLQNNEYTTNIDKLDTSNQGEIVLTITYQNLTTSVNLTISKKEEGGGSEESSVTEESSSTENSETEESSTEESNPFDKDDSPYEDNERTDLKDVGAIADIKAKVYDQNEYEPFVKVTVTVQVNGKAKKITLTEGADYRVSYQNNVNAGTGKVIVRGNGIYKGELTKEFTINQKPIKKLKIVAGSLAGHITGSDLSNLPIYVYDGTKRLQLGTDYTLSNYNSTKATAATVTVKAAENSNYTESTTVKLAVYDANTKIINPEHVTLDKQNVPYTGKAIKDVNPTVKIGETTLTTKDYKVQYQNNKDAGTAFVIVTGKGEYKGKVVAPFTITTATSNPMSIKPIPAKTYNAKLQKPTVAVSVNSDGKTKKLSKNRDYKVVYQNNFHAGTATVTVEGKGNYAGLSATATFEINPQAIKKASIKGTKDNLTLTYSKQNLKEGTDYEITKYDELKNNKVAVTIKGKGDFTGEVTKTVKKN